MRRSYAPAASSRFSADIVADGHVVDSRRQHEAGEIPEPTLPLAEIPLPQDDADPGLVDTRGLLRTFSLLRIRGLVHDLK